MSSITCSSCFASTDYKYNKPAFCSICGKNYLTGFTIAPEPHKPQSIAAQLRRIPEPLEDLSDYEEDYRSQHNSNAKNRWKSKPLNATVEIGPREKGKKFLDAAMFDGTDIRSNETKSKEEIMTEINRENGSVKSAPISLRDTSNDVKQRVG